MSASRPLRPDSPLDLRALVQQILLLAPVLLFSIIAHEIAHGYAALTQGDATAYRLGRLTWNPIKHIDPFMSIVLPAILIAVHGPVIGGAKPVPVDPRNYRNLKRGDIIVSLAGVTANVLIACACTALIPLFGLIGTRIPATAGAAGVAQAMAIAGIYINLILAAFNLFPVPPLDGSHVFKYLLPPAWAVQYQRVGFAGILILILLLNTPLLGFWLRPALELTRVLTTTVAPSVLPAARQWLQYIT